MAYSGRMTELQVDPDSASADETASGSAVIEAFFAALRANDLERALSMLSDDVEYQNVPLPRDHGRAQVERTLRRFLRVADEFDVTIHHMAEREGFVLTERTDYLRGPWLDLAFWVCGTFQVRDGKIVLWRDYFDLATVALQVLTSPLRRPFRARTVPSGT